MRKSPPRWNDAHTLRRCSDCGEYMTPDLFGRSARYWDGLDYYCALCRSDHKSQDYQRYKPQRDAQHAAWRAANPDRLHERQRVRNRIYRTVKRLQREREELGA